MRSRSARLRLTSAQPWAADGGNCLAILVRRDGESLNALLKRLDRAIGLAWSKDMFIDEVNDGESDLLQSPSQFHRQEGLEATLTLMGSYRPETVPPCDLRTGTTRPPSTRAVGSRRWS